MGLTCKPESQKKVAEVKVSFASQNWTTTTLKAWPLRQGEQDWKVGIVLPITATFYILCGAELTDPGKLSSS